MEKYAFDPAAGGLTATARQNDSTSLLPAPLTCVASDRMEQKLTATVNSFQTFYAVITTATGEGNCLIGAAYVNDMLKVQTHLQASAS